MCTKLCTDKYLKELIFVLALAVFFLTQKSFWNSSYRLVSADKWMMAFMGICILFFILPIGDVDYISKAIYLKNLLLIGFAYFVGRNTYLTDADLSIVFRFVHQNCAFCGNISLFKLIYLVTGNSGERKNRRSSEEGSPFIRCFSLLTS